MAYDEDDYLQLSGIQHFCFCRRQWALIHIEQQWEENYFTADGQIFHRKAHDYEQREIRGDVLTVRALKVSSSKLGISGECDVVEFHKDDNGITLSNMEGRWKPFPIEYKRGKTKSDSCDEIQLCAQAMCLEDMLCCSIQNGALYYGLERHRHAVIFSDDLRNNVVRDLKEMHRLYSRGYTPIVKSSKKCRQCSLKNICLPELDKVNSVSSYLLSGFSGDDA